MYFINHGLRMTWLDKYVKDSVSDDQLIGNVVNWPKHCFNLNASTFIKFIDEYECN